MILPTTELCWEADLVHVSVALKLQARVTVLIASEVVRAVTETEIAVLRGHGEVLESLSDAKQVLGLHAAIYLVEGFTVVHDQVLMKGESSQCW